MLSISYIHTSSNGSEEITRADVLWVDILSLTGTIRDEVELLVLYCSWLPDSTGIGGSDLLVPTVVV